MDIETVRIVAAELHERWRAEYGDLPYTGSTDDSAWIDLHGTDQVDISACTYSELPADWREEYWLSARAITDFLEDHPNLQLLRNDPDLRAAAGTALHTTWRAQNDWARGRSALDTSYARLPRAEQEKYLAQLDVALGVLETAGAL